MDESTAKRRREGVERMVKALARGESGSRWELSGLPTREDRDFVGGVMQRLQPLVDTLQPAPLSGFGRGAPALIHTAKHGADISMLLTENGITWLCWPSMAPKPGALVAVENRGQVSPEPEEPATVGIEEPTAPPDVLMRIVGMLAENMVYLRNRVDELHAKQPQPAQGPTLERKVDTALITLANLIEDIQRVKADYASAALVESMLSLLGEIEKKVSVPAAAPSPIPIELHAKLSDAIKSNNAVVSVFNTAFGALDKRVAQMEQGLGELMKQQRGMVERVNEVSRLTPTFEKQVDNTGKLVEKLSAFNNTFESGNRGLAVIVGAIENVMAMLLRNDSVLLAAASRGADYISDQKLRELVSKQAIASENFASHLFQDVEVIRTDIAETRPNGRKP